MQQFSATRVPNSGQCDQKEKKVLFNPASQMSSENFSEIWMKWDIATTSVIWFLFDHQRVEMRPMRPKWQTLLSHPTVNAISWFHEILTRLYEIFPGEVWRTERQACRQTDRWTGRHAWCVCRAIRRSPNAVNRNKKSQIKTHTNI